MANGKEAVIFIRGASPYISGDRAVFSTSKSKEYVDRGVAIYADRQFMPDRQLVAGAGAGKGSEVPVKAESTKNPKGKAGKRKRLVLDEGD